MRAVLQSKLSRSLLPIFVSVVAVPLIVTLVVVGRIGHRQILATVHAMERINILTIQDASKSFQRLGQITLRESSLNIASDCTKAVRLGGLQSQNDQTASLTESRRDFAGVSQKEFEVAIHQSLQTNKQVMTEIDGQDGRLFASSSHFTEERVGDKVQSAILDQIDAQMSERASQLSAEFDSYIETNLNYLGLTAEMLNLYQNDRAGQKAVLDALVRRFPMLEEVSLLDASGQETAMSDANKVVYSTDLKSQSFAPYFKEAIEDKTYIGFDQFPVDGSAPVLRLAVPVEAYKGKAVGVLSARLSLEDLWDMIRDAHFGKSGYAYVTDDGGYPFILPRHVDGVVLQESAPIRSVNWRLVVAQPQLEVMEPIDSFRGDIARNTQRSLEQMHQDIARTSKLATARLVRESDIQNKEASRLLQLRTDQIIDKLNNETIRKFTSGSRRFKTVILRQVAVTTRENDDEMIAAANAASRSLEDRIPGMTAAALQDAVKRLHVWGMSIFFVSCLISCIIGFFLSAAVVKPIIELLQGTRWLAAGCLDKRVDEHAPAEIGDLAIAFNMMARSLQKSREDLNEAESHLVQSAKLASLGTLSAGVAHELNQPVAIVRGIAQQLKTDRSISPDTLEDLEIIEGQTTRMMKIITHLRTFCRAGGYEQVPVDVNQVIRDCFILIDAQLKSHGVLVKMDLCDSVPTVMGDSNELEQVFINLITNARDAMHETRDPCLFIRTSVQDGKVNLEFRDNGPGIANTAADHIFDPFFTTKEVGKGTGLGLSISHGIVEKHAGSIVVTNDNGAVFTIAIPLISEEHTWEQKVSRISRPQGQAA